MAAQACYFWRTLYLRCPANAVLWIGATPETLNADAGLAFCAAHAQYIVDGVYARSWRARPRAAEIMQALGGEYWRFEE